MSDAELPLRAATADDLDSISRLLYMAFHEPFDAEMQELERAIYEPQRCLLAEDHGSVVAHAGVFSRELTVPGAVLPAAHVTMVGVAPTHRRRRLLTRMMHRQLHEIRAAGREPLAVLWASEGRIYQRFGYGLAAQKLELQVNTREVRLAEPPAAGQPPLRLVDPGTGVKELIPAFERLRPSRPGWSGRTPDIWAYVLADPPSRRQGGTQLRAVVVDGPDGVAGYATWRTREHPSGEFAEVLAREVVADSVSTYRRLWDFLLNIDLTRAVRFTFAAPDEPLLHLVDEPRRLGGRLSESLWVRLVDVPSALAARRYATAVDVVVDVTDDLLPENTGRFRLTGGPDGASCTPTEAPADLACGVRELGSAYLGGTSLATLAAAGRVRELRPGTLTAASLALGWHRPPYAIEVF